MPARECSGLHVIRWDTRRLMRSGSYPSIVSLFPWNQQDTYFALQLTRGAHIARSQSQLHIEFLPV